MANKKTRAVFIDRDGVLNDMVERPAGFIVHGKEFRYTAPFSYTEFKLRNGVSVVLGQLSAAGFMRILVTNQPDIRYGMLPIHEHAKIMEDVKKLPLDDIFVCMHGRDDGCECKKPKPGMLLEAARKWGISLEDSWMIGDSKVDVLAGQAAGCKTILVKGPDIYDGPTPNFLVDDFSEIVTIISQ